MMFVFIFITKKNLSRYLVTVDLPQSFRNLDLIPRIIWQGRKKLCFDIESFKDKRQEESADEVRPEEYGERSWIVWELFCYDSLEDGLRKALRCCSGSYNGILRHPCAIWLRFFEPRSADETDDDQTVKNRK